MDDAYSLRNHHRSSESSAKTNYFTEWDDSWWGRDLLAHEFNHSWNGKYRRPAGIRTSTYNEVKRDHGLWAGPGTRLFNLSGKLVYMDTVEVLAPRITPPWNACRT